MLISLVRVYLRRANAKKERAASEAQSSDTTGLMADFQDLTDKEHPEFRYVF